MLRLGIEKTTLRLDHPANIIILLGITERVYKDITVGHGQELALQETTSPGCQKTFSQALPHSGSINYQFKNDMSFV